MSDDLTLDRLLGGRVSLSQPAQGYRVAMDPVLLAAAVPAIAGERVLDAGAGTGAAALCLAVRVPGCKVVGIELQRALQQIAAANVAQNGLGERVEMLVGDLVQPPPRFAWGSFDHVMTNPPYLAAQAASAPSLPQRAIAHVEGDAPLAAWLQGCVRMLRPGGMLTMIHRAERLSEILAALGDALGGLILYPLWPGDPHRPAGRILVQGRKGSRAPLALLPGLVLHRPDGPLSAAAEAVLRHGDALVLCGDRPGGRNG
ncbi:MAG TPA: methyltransferase domain-containing protein [Geminicoccaceae bacterium]|nr:methyltransferase domain-containing protein [Geminicoccaceae bacterium]